MNKLRKIIRLSFAIVNIMIRKLTRDFAFTASFTCPDKIFIAVSTKILPYAFINARAGTVKIGEKCYIDRNVILSCNGGDISIGNHCSLNPFCVVYGGGGLTIGNDVRIATGTVIVPFNHGFADRDIKICYQERTARGIKIEDNCWIGANVTILDGVTIGQGCIIGAGSVVTKSVPSFSIAAGNPVRVIKER